MFSIIIITNITTTDKNCSCFLFTTHFQDSDSFSESIHLLSKQLSSALSKNVPEKKNNTYTYIYIYIITNKFRTER